MDLVTYAVLNKKIDTIGNIPDEKITEAVNTYLDENPPVTGATAEQAAQIDKNVADIGELKSDIIDLKDNKITKFYTNNNGDTVLNDSDDGKIQDLVIYGKSEQAQYEGINILNYKKETETANGIAFTYDKKNQVYKVNGTATEQVNKSIFEKAENIYVGKKIVGCPSGGQSNTYSIVISYFDGAGVWKNESYDTGDGQTIKDYPKLSISILVRDGVTVNNLVFKPMIVEDTTKTYDDFEPYTGGKPSPSTEYPQEIKAVVNPVIKTHGKNLIDFRKAKGGIGEGVTFIVNADGSINRRGTATGSVGNVWFLGRYMNTEPEDKDVIFTLKKGKTYYIKDCLLFSVVNGNVVASFENKVTPPTEVKINGIRNSSFTVGKTYNDTIYPIVAEANEAVDWKPYQETQATLHYELYAIPVSSDGNVTIDGQQYIADYVDIENKKLVRNINKIQLTKTNCVLTNYSAGVLQFDTRINGEPPYKYDDHIRNFLCNYFAPQYSEGTMSLLNDLHFFGYSNQTLFSFKDLSKTTLSDWENFLDNNEVYLLYELSTPTEVFLTDEEVQAFKSLATYYTKTYVTTESEQLEAYTMFNYPVSMEKGWEYVKQQIGDTRKYVYDMDLQSAEAYVNSEYAVALTELEV